MHLSTLYSLAGASLVATVFADQTVIQAYLLGSDNDNQVYEASIVTANPTSTSMVVNCPTNSNSANCNLLGPVTLQHIDHSIWIATGSAFGLLEAFDCTVVTETTQAVCSISEGVDASLSSVLSTASGISLGGLGVTSTTLTGSSAMLTPITVTAGQQYLGNTASSTASTTGSSTSASSSPSASSTSQKSGASLSSGVSAILASVIAFSILAVGIAAL